MVGTLTQSIQVLTQGFAALQAEVQSDRNRIKSLEDRGEKLSELLTKALERSDEEREKSVRKIRDRNYNFYRQAFGIS